jgi:uncharacterized protein YegP (UPF0339 family)
MKMKKLQKRRWWRSYKDRSGKFRVHSRASNGKTVWASSQGYRYRDGAIKNAQREGDAPVALYFTQLGVELRWPAKS